MPTETAILESAYSEFLSALTKRLPGVIPELRQGVPCELPYAGLPGTEQLAALWRLTSGQDQGKDGTLGIAGGLRLLGPVESESERARWTAMMNKGIGIDAVANPSWDGSSSLDPEAVRPVYYAAGWLPLLSEPYEANYLAVDLVPLPAGQPGQIILCGRDEDHKCLVAPDLATLFRALAAECQTNAWSLKETLTNQGKTVRFIERKAGRLLSSCKNRNFPGRAFRSVR
jgi:cell wall assembly regulator SMI1